MKINLKYVLIGLSIFVVFTIIKTGSKLPWSSSELQIRQLFINSSSSNKTWTSRENKSIIKIVVFSPYSDGFVKRMEEIIPNMNRCYYNNCVLSIERKETLESVDADAILFQGNRAPRNLPRRRDENQVYIFYNSEAPLNLKREKLWLDQWRYFYNWSITYRDDSEIPLKYGLVLLKSEQFNETLFNNGVFYTNKNRSEEINRYYHNDIRDGIDGKQYSDIFNRKTKSAAWLVSHCNTSSQREKYAEVMAKTIDVDIFGKCSDCVCPKGLACADMIIKNYKFYLAFENSLCKDYMTEKVFKWFDKDIVLVVRGHRTNSRYLPRGTYVDANDFSSARDLANYLIKLGKNETEYVNILKRKDKFKVINPYKVLFPTAFCNLCRKLNNLDKYRSTIANLYEWWEKDQCIKPNMTMS